jgi:hypothetical protein
MTINNSTKYDANFTAGGIFFNEFFALKEILLSNNFDVLIKIEEIENNRIGIKTKAARQRIIREIKRRYNEAPVHFWSNFFEWKENEQRLGLFFLCLKTYPLIFDIHFEVTVKKFKTVNTLQAYDIQMRMDEIASVDVNVANWSPITFNRINSHYRTALKNVGLYNGNILIKESKATKIFWDYFKKNNESWFLEACFINI